MDAQEKSTLEINDQQTEPVTPEQEQELTASEQEQELITPEKEEKKKTRATHKVLLVVGIILSLLFGFTLACNLTIIIKGALYPDTPPSVLGKTPLVVLTGSMSGNAPDHVEIGDLILVDKADTNQLKVGDVIAYKSGKAIVLHRIIEIRLTENGNREFITKGDANNTADINPVPADRVVGIYTQRIPQIGHYIMFTQTPLGIILFLILPILCFVAYDGIRRKYYADKEKKKTEELEAELERLRALNSEEKVTEETAQSEVVEVTSEPV